MAETKPKCGNPDHSQRDAYARLIWPDGRFYPTLACKTCIRQHIFFYVIGAEGEYHPMLVLPLDHRPAWEPAGGRQALRMAVHRAIADPGAVLPREDEDLGGEKARESLPRWQMRAVLTVVEPLLALAEAEAVNG